MEERDSIIRGIASHLRHHYFLFYGDIGNSRILLEASTLCLFESLICRHIPHPFPAPDRSLSDYLVATLGGLLSPSKNFAKVFQALRSRPLWRGGRFDICINARQFGSGSLLARFSTTTSQKNDNSPETEVEGLVSGRVHILGSGNAGIFIAQSLAKRECPPDVTLFMVNWGMYEAYRQRKKRLTIDYDGLTDGLKKGIGIEVLTGGKWYRIPPDYGEKYEDNGERIDHKGSPPRPEKAKEPIDCLVVACKSNQAFNGIRSLKKRLTSDSTIMLVQNGLGVAERLNRFVFPDPSRRPNYLHAVFSHGMDKKDMYNVRYKTVGTTNIAPPAPREITLAKPEDDTSWAPSMKYLTRLFTLTPSLVAFANTPTNVLMYQLEKLAVSSVIDPLTALNDCRNGDLLYVESVSRLMRLLLLEISRVIMAFPELQGVPGLEDRFLPERLRRLVVWELGRTRRNISPMLHDVKHRRGTEVEYLNGYIVRRGEELGITCVINYMIKHLIHAKQMIYNRAEAEAVPIDSDFEMQDSSHLTGPQITTSSSPSTTKARQSVKDSSESP